MKASLRVALRVLERAAVYLLSPLLSLWLIFKLLSACSGDAVTHWSLASACIALAVFLCVSLILAWARHEDRAPAPVPLEDRKSWRRETASAGAWAHVLGAALCCALIGAALAF